MTDKKKVTRGLECHLKYETNTENAAICDECPYHEENDLGACYLQIFKDALELLKEQEVMIRNLKEMLGPLEHGDQATMQSGLMPAI